MTDIQDFTQPAPAAPAAPEPPLHVGGDPVSSGTEPGRLSQRGRPSRVVQRDLAVARTLAEEERSLHAVMAALELPWRVTYNSVCRLRERGLVELNRNGTRTPTWRVTERGHEWLGTTGTQDPLQPPTPPPAPVPTPVPEVPTVASGGIGPGPEPEPEPIEPPAPSPEPEPAPELPPEPTSVAPAPGPAEPVWPI